MIKTKKALRREMLEKRNSLSRETIAAAGKELTEMLVALPEWKAAQSIYVYLSYGNEINTDGIINIAFSQGKTVAAPVCIGRRMEFRIIDENSVYTLSGRGIREPSDNAKPACDRHALVILPGLAFTREGKRLGYGGGFYDRFLAAEPEHPTAALCFDFQLINDIPQDEYDIPADTVLSVNVQQEKQCLPNSEM